ncbi:TM0106 family RecB-like putative nuclease [uncultured Friedmanniella sp.]|uniref:TM0106 family RecB-like putative nuclease n=1 Tax=uncultured Friedmanniella sp. TaxID=335381 RepID=UPI0035CBEDCE
MSAVAAEPAATTTREPVLLGSTAAGSCPVKTHHAYDPTATLPTVEGTSGPTPLPERVQHAREVEARLLEALIAAAPGLVVDLRLLAEEPGVAAASCLRAMTVGAEVIVGGLLPADQAGGRLGRPDVLVRGADSAEGRPTYHPVEVKAHKVLLTSRRRGAPPEEPPPPAVHVSPFTAPRPLALEPLPGAAFRLRTREADLLQLAHFTRMLQAAGFAAAQPLAAVIGTDTGSPAAPLLAWFDLSVPLVRTFSRLAPEGWRLRSVLERYDHEHALRLDVAAVARRQRGAADDPAPLVQPVVGDECGRCPWWSRCRPGIADDDVSLRIGKGALDVREVLALRRLGVGTVSTLAAADLTELLPAYLPHVTHRGGADGRLRVANRRARMLRDDVDVDRETTGEITFPGAEVEVDLDIESAADGRIYLWGFLVHDRRGSAPPTYTHVSAFDDLDEADELDLARSAFGWLRDLVNGSPSVRVYHYSAYEPAAIRGLADRVPDDPLLAWAASYAEAEFVDLYDVVKTHFFGVNGLGLKPIAQHAGFRWRDDDPGGLNSQAWFADAVHHVDPAVRDRARTRVLEYNEDDVTATQVLRSWLRSG